MSRKGKDMRQEEKTYMMVTTAVFAALLAAASWIAVPVPFTPVPINLGTLAVTLAGAILGYKYGTLSVFIYILLGAVGVPVFAGFTGGIGHIAGPTGGYIIGYLTSAFICGLILETMCADRHDRKRLMAATALGSVLGTASCYVLGTIWFMILTGTGLTGSLSMCVIPFLPGDAVKTAAAVFLVTALDPVITKMSILKVLQRKS